MICGKQIALQVTQLRQKDLDDVLPRLNHLLESSHGAYNFARGQMRQEVVDWRDQSAQHLLRDSTCECGIRALFGQDSLAGSCLIVKILKPAFVCIYNAHAFGCQICASDMTP